MQFPHSLLYLFIYLFLLLLLSISSSVNGDGYEIDRTPGISFPTLDPALFHAPLVLLDDKQVADFIVRGYPFSPIIIQFLLLLKIK